ncbi:DUF4350 domain-containing protein [Kitasatospora cinereorecta]|uniref:DUF4350 domain-containing protein n=1 Tax=Kitasatospora cinereorecta TaxID=285560 RepID=A0ABW0VSG1_9ACTN
MTATTTATELPTGPSDAAEPVAPAPDDAAAHTSVSPTARTLWRRSRWYLFTALALLLVGLLIAGISGQSTFPALDPRSGDREGTLAAVHLLEKRGITVRTVDTERDLEAALRTPGATVVVPRSDLLSTAQLRRLAAVPRGEGRLVLIAPQQPALDQLMPGSRVAGQTEGPANLVDTLTTPAGCTLPEANRAGSAELGGLTYLRGADDTGCYARHGHPTLLHRASGGRETVALGTGDPLTNDRIAEEGNASLALGLLGSRPQLVWYLPDYSAPAPSVARKSFTDYVPAGWYWATLQLAVAAGLAALWRARRLGPVVTEPLPVVVRATETTEGRARLYQRARAHGRAADALRRATRHRLAAALGIPATTGDVPEAALCAAVAARLGHPAADVQQVLYGPAPTDDAALLRLTDDLDALERQVRQP